MMIVPSQYQPELPQDRLILRERPGDEAIPVDVLFVGAGPGGLAGAIRLAQLVRADGGLGQIEIGVLEKSESLGEHCLSGALVDPGPFRTLFPELGDDDLPFRRPVERERVYWLGPSSHWRIPAPPEMRNHGNWVASICEIVRWMGQRAEELGGNIFSGFPGTRSALAQAWTTWQRVGSANPQIYALGVKELWETKRPLDAVMHTLGWPLPGDAFGGSWIYPMADDMISLGLVVGLDYRDHNLDVHVLTQRLKSHPLLRPYLEGGELVEWGAKTIPEGGYHSLPERLHGDGLLIVGDAAGLVNVAALKGIHYAVQSGILAAETVFRALKAGDTSRSVLSAYDAVLRSSFVHADLRRTRNMRLAFKSGFYSGGVKASLMSLTGGAFPGSRIDTAADSDEPRRMAAEPDGFGPDGKLTFSKLDAVFRSGNATRDDIPSHLLVGEDVPAEVADFYRHVCPAGVYEWDGDRLVVNAPNCVDCKATDVLGPRWSPREGGSGPRYKRM